MKKTLLALAVAATLSTPLRAQNWSLGVATGPFVFGDFVRRTLTTSTETGTGSQTTKLSASTRAGLSVDIERSFSERFAVRAEGTFTRAPLAIKGSSGNGVSLDAGDLNVGTFMLPLVFRINPNGTFRFHLLGGPAYAAYRITRQQNASSSISEFVGTRSRWGVAGGGGVAWQWSKRFGVEGQIVDISTSSPFERDDFPRGFGKVEIPRTHNVHTTIGLRVKF